MKITYSQVMEAVYIATTDDGVTSWTDYKKFTELLNELIENELEMKLKALRLRDGDILLVERGDNLIQQLDALQKAGCLES